MKIQAKSFYSLEIEDSLTKYWPDDIENFGTWIRVQIGPTEGRGSEAFDFLVCTPEWLRIKCASAGPQLGGYMIIVANYDLEKLMRFIETRISSIVGDDWKSISTKLGRIGACEFEDYQ